MGNFVKIDDLANRQCHEHDDGEPGEPHVYKNGYHQVLTFCEPSVLPLSKEELFKKMERIVGYIPEGAGDLLRVLAHPDLLELTIAYFNSKEK